MPRPVPGLSWHLQLHPTHCGALRRLTEPRYRARVELMLKMADEGKTVEEMAEALNRSVNKIEFYLARCGLIKDYTYTEDGEVIKKTKNNLWIDISN